MDMSNEYLADTVIYTVGSLAEWLVDNTQFISLLLPLVVPGLQVTPLTVFLCVIKHLNLETRISSDISVNSQTYNTGMPLSI